MRRWLLGAGGAGAVAVLVLGGIAAWNWFLPPGPGYGEENPGLFQDCGVCPEMAPIPPGAMTMGAPDRFRFRLLALFGIEAGPRRHVTVDRPYAMGRTEVTFDQWEACVADGGCDAHMPADEGWGRGDHPVIHVSWNQAQGYVRWLSEKTGERYRLPTEAEWEYAARAGTRHHPYPWGRFPDHDKANIGGPDCPPCTGVVKGKDIWPNTAPVGSFPPNGFGLHDMNGNVYEWVEDCLDILHPGSFGQEAQVNATCENRSMRGGAWYSDPHRVTNVYRAYNPPYWADWVIGFRVARDM